MKKITKNPKQFGVKGDLQTVMLWKGLSLQWIFGCSVLQGPEGCSVQNSVNLLIFSFGDALFPKDILAPALIWHSGLTRVEPTKTQRSNTQLCVFCFIAYLLIISFTPPAFKLIFSYGGKRPPAGDLIGQFGRQRAGILLVYGIY